MYVYGWVPLLSTWNYHNIVDRLYSNTNKKVKKKKKKKHKYCQQTPEAGRDKKGSSPWAVGENVAVLTPWFQTSSLHNQETLNLF